MRGTSMPPFFRSQIERAVGLPRWRKIQNIVVDIDSFRGRIYVKECRLWMHGTKDNSGDIPSQIIFNK